MYFKNNRMSVQGANVQEKTKQITQVSRSQSGNNDNIKTAGDNIIYFYQDIDEVSMLTLKSEIQKINQTFDLWSTTIKALRKEDLEIQLHIYTSGGDIFAGFHLYDFIKSNRYKINTFNDGYVCSAGTLLFLSGNKRFIYDNSFTLIHQLRTMIGYVKFSQLDDQHDNKKKFMEKAKNIYLTELDITEQQLQMLLKRDIFLTKEQCEKYKFEK